MSNLDDYSLSFEYTPHMLEAIKTALELPNISELQKSELKDWENQPSASFALLKTVADVHREAGNQQFAFVHKLCAHSSVYVAPPPGIQRTPEFAAYLEKLKIKQENARYEEVVASTRKKKLNLLGDDTNLRAETQSIREQLSTGMNVIAAMFTGFMVFYYIGSSVFHDNPTMAYASGAVGIVGALAVEIGLFIVRAEREELIKKRPNAGVAYLPKSMQPTHKSRVILPSSSSSPSSTSKASSASVKSQELDEKAEKPLKSKKNE